MEKVFEIYIKTTPERLWQAITDTEMRRKYTFGAVVTSDWTTGSRYEGRGHRRSDLRGRESRGRSAAPAGPELPSALGRGREERGDLARDLGDRAGRRFCRLTVTHDQLREGANTQLYGGWPMILSGIKTLLETGEMLTTPGSLRWLEGNTEHLPEVR